MQEWGESAAGLFGYNERTPGDVPSGVQFVKSNQSVQRT